MGKYVLAIRELGRWFERHGRMLPWRDDPSLYRVWISEIMAQQTQIGTVVPYFERFVARFPSVEKLAAAPESDVLLLWAGLGYYSRARNIHRAAQQIVERGDFPRTCDEWLEIPGVGPYTAGAIVSIALNQPEAILDGNVERVLSRVHRVAREKGDAAYKARLWELAAEVVETGYANGVAPSVINQALMELGATHCSPRKPTCGVCPLAKVCEAAKHKETDSFPPKKKPKQWIDVREELHLVMDSRGRALVHQRAVGQWRAGLWDLPESRPAPGTAEKLGAIESHYVVTRHKVTRQTHVWKLKTARGLKAAESTGARWVTLAAPEVAVGSPFRKVVQLAGERFDL